MYKSTHEGVSKDIEHVQDDYREMDLGVGHPQSGRPPLSHPPSAFFQSRTNPSTHLHQASGDGMPHGNAHSVQRVHIVHSETECIGLKDRSASWRHQGAVGMLPPSSCPSCLRSPSPSSTQVPTGACRRGRGRVTRQVHGGRQGAGPDCTGDLQECSSGQRGGGGTKNGGGGTGAGSLYFSVRPCLLTHKDRATHS